jgi:mono/diheme cytochrome c family protein
MATTGRATRTPPAHQAASANTTAPAGGVARDILNKYCVTCHNERTKTAGLLLDVLDTNNIGADAEQWEKVAVKLRTREMPPPGRPRPDQTTYDALATHLEDSLDAFATAHVNPGRVVAHRLNREEYTNAIRDLLGLQIDGSSLLMAATW